MRRVSGLVAILALGAMWMPAALANGGTGMEFECYDAVASPGETVRAAVSLTNESDRPYRYRVKARTRGDNELVRGRHRRVRGKWTKMKFTLEPGETHVEEMMLRVPNRAEGPMVAEIKVRGPDGRNTDRDSLFVHDDGEVVGSVDIFTGENDVAEERGINGDGSVKTVVESEFLARFSGVEPPSWFSLLHFPGNVSGTYVTASSRVERAFGALGRICEFGEFSFDFFSGAEAGIDHSLRF